MLTTNYRMSQLLNYSNIALEPVRQKWGSDRIIVFIAAFRQACGLPETQRELRKY